MIPFQRNAVKNVGGLLAPDPVKNVGDSVPKPLLKGMIPLRILIMGKSTNDRQRGQP